MIDYILGLYLDTVIVDLDADAFMCINVLGKLCVCLKLVCTDQTGVRLFIYLPAAAVHC